KRGMLGVTIESVTSVIAEKADLDVIKGVYIVNTTEDGAARKADLRAADIILEVNGFPVNEVNELQEKVAMYRPGDIVRLKLWRNGMEIYKSVELKELKLPFQPEEPQIDEFIDPEDQNYENNSNPEFRENSGVYDENFEIGFTIRALATPENPEKFDLYIHILNRNTPAWNSGLDEGMKVLEIDDQNVYDLVQFRLLLEEALKKKGSSILKTETEDRQKGYYQLTIR
ncbi:MAG: PDZ domain-containing protein, partial [Balneolaceae bacterium]